MWSQTLMYHVDPYVCICFIGVTQTQQKANAVQMPLQFFQLDAPFAEGVAHQHVEDNYPQQYQPD